SVDWRRASLIEERCCSGDGALCCARAAHKAARITAGANQRHFVSVVMRMILGYLIQTGTSSMTPDTLLGGKLKCTKAPCELGGSGGGVTKLVWEGLGGPEMVAAVPQATAKSHE